MPLLSTSATATSAHQNNTASSRNSAVVRSGRNVSFAVTTAVEDDLSGDVDFGDGRTGASLPVRTALSSSSAGTCRGLCDAVTRCLLCPCTALHRALFSLAHHEASDFEASNVDDEQLDTERLLAVDGDVGGGVDGMDTVARSNLQSSVTRRGAVRGYGPPRSTTEGGGDAEDSDRDSASGSTTTDTSSSAVTLTRWGARTGTERWVMQRGVLVRVGADGVAREVTDSQANRLRQLQSTRVDRSGATWDTRRAPPCSTETSERRRKLRTEDQQDWVEGADVPRQQLLPTTAAAAAPEPKEGVLDSVNTTTTVTAVVDELESLRTPVYTLEQLVLFAERCARYLPVRVEVTSGEGLRGSYSLHLLGPLQPTEYAEVFSVLEDVLLDDCDESALCLTGLHISDINFANRANSQHHPVHLPMSDWPGRPSHRGTGITGAGPSSSSSPSPARAMIGAEADAAAMGRQRAWSNAYLDQLPSLNDDTDGNSASLLAHRQGPSDGHAWGAAQAGGVSAPRGPPPPPLSPQLVKECATRFLAFVKNVVEGRARSIQAVHLTRCLFTPLDLGRTLPLPLVPLRRLLFEQCLLTPAHVDALLVLARAQNRKNQNRLATIVTNHGNGPNDGHARTTLPAAAEPGFSGDTEAVTARELMALGSVSEMQLSGSLTEDAVTELLNYFHDDVAIYGKPALQVLRLPSLLLRVAQEHPFVEAHPYVQVLPAQ